MSDMNIDFTKFFLEFKNSKNKIVELILHSDEAKTTLATNFNNELNEFETKFRLAIAIEEITLSSIYVATKGGSLKECHLMFYKLIDCWFAYETFLKQLNNFKKGIEKNKVSWLDEKKLEGFKEDIKIKASFQLVNTKLNKKFDDTEKRNALKGYIDYCSSLATFPKQKNYLSEISLLINDNEIKVLTATQILSLTYAIRNNFVHNGEITLLPKEFDYDLKNNLLKILYENLVVSITQSVIILIDEFASKNSA